MSGYDASTNALTRKKKRARASHDRMEQLRRELADLREWYAIALREIRYLRKQVDRMQRGGAA